MTLLAFILFWILVGLGLFFVAMSGGPRGARRRLQSQTRRGQRIAYGGFALALLCLGVLIPAGVIAIVRDRDSIPEANVTSLTEAEQRGRELFGERCRNCHTLEAAAAYANVGPNLDELRPPENLVKDAIENGRSRGNGQMAADLVVGDDVDAVSAFVAKAVGQDAESTGAPAEGDGGEATDAGDAQG